MFECLDVGFFDVRGKGSDKLSIPTMSKFPL